MAYQKQPASAADLATALTEGNDFADLGIIQEDIIACQKQPASTVDLATALTECNSFANRGQALATNAVSNLERVVETVSDKIQYNITNLTTSNFNDNATYKNLAEQLSSINSNFKQIPQRLNEDIECISKTSFSITLFGRTMAGKSTLMAILTQGNGEAIGHGAQRMTRDVRSYKYKGLNITDVPGIAAFEGQEDEEVAFNAAKKCDLILFLITDDAPQACEAECLNRILALGKPVICLINVKVNINTPSDMKLFTRDIQKKMENDRLDKIKKQFFEFGKQYGQDWHTIRFAYVHLKSAYLSQQSHFTDIRDKLYQLSRFNYVENLITSEVVNNGGFYKLKAFSDIVAVPVVDALETLFSQSAQNSQQGAILVGKNRKLKKWAEEFEADGKQRIETLIFAISSDLRKDIGGFAENNYDNPNAGEKWNNVVKARNIEGRAKDLLNQLSKECTEELSEISREIDSEINFSHTVFSEGSINMDRFVDGKRIWNWGILLVSGGLVLAGLFSLPVAVFVGVLSLLGSFLFDDREKKKSDARQKLEKKLSNHIDRITGDLKRKMLDSLYKDLLKKQLYPMKHTIDEFINSMFLLSKTQRDFAVSLNKSLEEINNAVIKEALSYLGYTGLEYHITRIARVPGYAMMFVLEYGKRFPDDTTKSLRCLLKERVWFVFYNENLKSMLSQAIGRGCDRNTISIQSIDAVPRIAHIPSIGTLDTSTKNRIRLAQQLTELLIMK